MTAHNRGWVSPSLIMIFLLGGLVSLGAVWVSQGIVAAEHWPIKFIRLENNLQRVSREQLRGAVYPYVQTGFFSINMDEIQSAAEKLPWIDQVVIRKEWPDTVWMEVSEHVPVARWDHNRLVDTKGQLFEIPAGYAQFDLPRLQGHDRDAEQIVGFYSEIQGSMQRNGLALSRLKRTERGSWEIWLLEGLQIVLGRDAPKEKLERFYKVWPSLQQNKDQILARVDMRYPNGMAILEKTNEELAILEAGNE